MRQRSVPLNDLISPREHRGRHIEPEGRTRVNKRVPRSVGYAPSAIRLVFMESIYQSFDGTPTPAFCC
jgi:hypothetical protein